MKKKFVIPLIALLFIGLAFSSGCIGESEAKEAPKGMFAGGSNGLVLSFMPGLPPDEVFENTKFTIGVKLENKGEHKVPEGVEVKIGGIPTGEDGFDLNQSAQSTKKELTGKTLVEEEVISGGFEIFNFPAESPTYPGDTEVTIIASSCFPYESLGVATVCLKDDLFTQATGAPEVCKVSGEKETYSRGAPIKVTKIKEIPMGEHRLGFKINIENTGDGQVYLPRTGCKGSDINKVSVKSVKIRDIVFSCSTKTITLVDGEGTVFCDKELPEDIGEYEDILKVILEYNYRTQATQKLNVLNVPYGESETSTENATEGEGAGAEQGTGS
ncbi:hypothetical protein GF374_01260 [Candidatus Woesearchaeota archaeon]|nr:hypothetical protein [Candidatus Woesearchaeota archaeon]